LTLALLLLPAAALPLPGLAGAGCGGAVLDPEDRVDLPTPGWPAETLALREGAALFFAGFFVAFFGGFFTDFFEAFFAGFFAAFLADFFADFFADFVLAISESLV
jgi:hypothetical protein